MRLLLPDGVGACEEPAVDWFSGAKQIEECLARGGRGVRGPRED